MGYNIKFRQALLDFHCCCLFLAIEKLINWNEIDRKTSPLMCGGACEGAGKEKCRRWLLFMAGMLHSIIYESRRETNSSSRRGFALPIDAWSSLEHLNVVLCDFHLVCILAKAKSGKSAPDCSTVVSQSEKLSGFPSHSRHGLIQPADGICIKVNWRRELVFN